MPFKKSEETTEFLSLGDARTLGAALDGYIDHLDDEKKKLLQETTIKFIDEQIKIEETKAKTFKKNPKAYQSSIKDINSLKALRSELKTKKLYNSNKSSDNLVDAYQDRLQKDFKAGSAYSRYIKDKIDLTSISKKEDATRGMLVLISKSTPKKDLYDAFKKIKPTLEESRGNRFLKAIEKLLPKRFSSVTGTKVARSIHGHFYKIEKRDVKNQKMEQRKRYIKP